MKNLHVTALSLCVCLFGHFSVQAMTICDDTTIVQNQNQDEDLRNEVSDMRDDTIVVYDNMRDDTIVVYDNMRDDTIVVYDNMRDDTTIVRNLNHSESLRNEDSKKNRKKATGQNDNLTKEQTPGIKLLREDNEVDYRDLRSVNEGTLIGIGGYKMKDTYLSPEKYGGLGFRFMNERIHLTKLANYKISNQKIVNVDISSTMNGARNANFLSAFADYSIGYHYRITPDPDFKLLVGASARGMIGMVYNTRNGNNPLTVHADVDLNFSFLTIYVFRIGKSPIAIRYQFETPLGGILFSPVYGQSYYEIFSLGNTAEIFNFSTLRNKFAMQHYMTLDFPIGGMTVRTGYWGSSYSTGINNIDRYIISHNVVIGFVKEFVAFGGREMRKRNLFNSAYY